MNFNAFEPDSLIFTFYLFFLLFATQVLLKRPNNRNKKIFFIFVSIQILLGGLRSYTVGSDTASYVDDFYNLKTSSIDDVFGLLYHDPYFYIYIKYISYYFGSYTILFLLNAIIFWFSVSYIYYRYSNNILLALCFLIFLREHYFVLSAMRQGLAMAIVLYSFRYLVSAKLWKYILTILLASLFHVSAIVLLPCYLLKKCDFHKWGIFIVCLIVPLYLASMALPNISFVDPSYTGYLNGDQEGGNYYTVLTTTLSFLFVYSKTRNCVLNDTMKLLYNITALGLLVAIISMKIDIFNRMADYFCMFMPIIMANSIRQNKQDTFIVFSTLAMIFIIYLCTGLPPGINDYKFFWEVKSFL